MPRATAAQGLVVLHIPHSSAVIPADVRDTLVVGDSTLERELLRLTDRYTDELYGLDPAIGTSVVFA